jgi:hypothetical protein
LKLYNIASFAPEPYNACSMAKSGQQRRRFEIRQRQKRRAKNKKARSSTKS